MLDELRCYPYDIRAVGDTGLDALRAVLEGDAAKKMDLLLGRLSGLRRAWTTSQEKAAEAPEASTRVLHMSLMMLHGDKEGQWRWVIVLNGSFAFESKDELDGFRKFCRQHGIEFVLHPSG